MKRKIKHCINCSGSDLMKSVNYEDAVYCRDCGTHISIRNMSIIPYKPSKELVYYI